MIFLWDVQFMVTAITITMIKNVVIKKHDDRKHDDRKDCKVGVTAVAVDEQNNNHTPRPPVPGNGTKKLNNSSSYCRCRN